MSTIDDVGQKVKGKMQQIKGDIESNTGHPVKGAWDKVKGNVNETLADAKIQGRKDSNEL